MKNLKVENRNRGTVKVNIGGGAFLSILTIAFIILKLLGKIQWSWIWVLAPVWIPIAAVLLVILIVAILASRS